MDAPKLLSDASYPIETNKFPKNHKQPMDKQSLPLLKKDKSAPPLPFPKEKTEEKTDDNKAEEKE